ncbi:MAG: tRNA pseudouridine(13) synthase TruD [Pseudomonadota bacterium]
MSPDPPSLAVNERRRQFLANLPRLNGGAVGSGVIRTVADDFVVAEELGFAPASDGAHWLVHVKKRLATTPWAAKVLSRAFAVPVREVGYSGLKDRHAVTTQWFSLPRQLTAERPSPGELAEGIEILEVGCMQRKLRRGVHKRNRFSIVVRDVDADASGLDAALVALRTNGFANYFGAQRFGRAGSNLDLATRLVDGDRVAKHQREYAVSAMRAYLFNGLAAARVGGAAWPGWQDGDHAILDGSNSHFSIAVTDLELAPRFVRGDVHPGATLWGRQGSLLDGAAAEQERALVARADNEVFGAWLERDRSASMLRAVRAVPSGFDWQYDRDARALELRFALGRGSFATALLDEVLRIRDYSAVSSNT